MTASNDTASNDNSNLDEENLYAHMPVYHSRLSSVQAILDQGTPLDLNAFHMHYDGTGPLQRAQSFFDESGVLLDLGCGYGSNIIWFAERALRFQRFLGVDLIKEHIDIANTLAARFLGEDERVRYLAYDVADLTPAIYSTHAGSEHATAVLALNTFLHLKAEQRTQCWHFIDDILLPGGKVYIEDFFHKGPLGEGVYDLMVEESGCAYLPDQDAHHKLIAEVLPTASIQVEDISDIYAGYAKQRHESYAGDDPGKRRFYKTVSDCLNGGGVGGIRIRVEKT